MTNDDTATSGGPDGSTVVGPERSDRSRFGVLILQDAAWPVLRERARRVEAMGFDTVWVGDHFVNPYAPRADWLEGWTLLAALAASTSTIRLGPLVTSNTLRNPVLLARMAMTVDHVSGGRLELGIGAAGAPLDYTMLGLPTWSPAERADRLEETLEILRALLETGELHHDGPHLVVEEALLAPLPVQRPCPPITVAGLGPRAIDVAARLGDAWNAYGVTAGRSATGRLAHDEAVAVTASRVHLLEAACDRSGRDASAVRRTYLSFRGILEPVGSPSDFARMVRDFRAIGIQDLSLYWPADTEGEAALEAVAREALPDLRA